MAKLTKTLEQLIERAERKGRAVKRVRQGAVMGASWGMSREAIKDTPMIEQWAVTNQTVNYYSRIAVFHYGTQIANIVQCNQTGNAYLGDYYGESNSDRDALNGLCDYYGIDAGFRYRPSTGEFTMTA